MSVKRKCKKLLPILAVMVWILSQLNLGYALAGEAKFNQLLAEPDLTCEVNHLAVQVSDANLQQGVKEFIANNYLAHAAEFPDPNESVEVLRLYLDGQEMLEVGAVEEAIKLFKSAVANHPDSRHAHAGLAWALWQKYQESQAEDDLRLTITEFILASEIGMEYGRVHYTSPIAIGLGLLKDSTTLEQFFKKALKHANEPYLVSLDYAQGLSLLEDLQAERWYKKAIAYEPEGLADAVAYYAEWLLDHKREAEVVELVKADISVEYTHFLKGVALERLGRQSEARQEYERYRKLNAVFPAPAKYRIENSRAQSQLVFEGDIQRLSSQSQAITKLSRVISGESRGESVGAQRAVGWTVRTRVFQAYSVPSNCGGYGNPYNGCWGAKPSSASRAEKYIAIADSSERPSVCGPQFYQYTPTPSTNSRAYEVWYGSVPDPITCTCKAGEIIGSCCNGTCSQSTTQGAFSHGPAWFTYYCTYYWPSSSCSQYRVWKPCGNGGTDNCFYKIK